VSHILSILEGYNMSHQDFATVSGQVTILHRIVEAFELSLAKRPLLADPQDDSVVKVGCVLFSSKAVCASFTADAEAIDRVYMCCVSRTRYLPRA
jgi:hypothetical protein